MATLLQVRAPFIRPTEYSLHPPVKWKKRQDRDSARGIVWKEYVKEGIMVSLKLAARLAYTQDLWRSEALAKW